MAPGPDMIEPLLGRFVEGYGLKMLSKLQRIIGVGASHHRLAWIYPFFDGNGRVSRLFSHALLRDLGIGSELWSVSRGACQGIFRITNAFCPKPISLGVVIWMGGAT
nr:Fic family protein [Mycoplana dimorpha]